MYKCICNTSMRKIYLKIDQFNFIRGISAALNQIRFQKTNYLYKKG